MECIGITVEKGDRHACCTNAVELRQRCVQSRLVEGAEHGAGGIDALRHSEAAEARD
jgi:hypothetical protein